MSQSTIAKRVSSIPGSLTVEWANGAVSEFASVWLRDNLREDRDPHSGQRLIDIADLPEEPRIRSAVAEDRMVRVEWESEARAASFDLDWLALHASGSAPQRPELESRLWLEGALLDASRAFAWTTLAEARGSPGARLAWLTRLLQDGIAFLSDVPSQEEAILDAMSLVGRVAETNYGLVFDVRSVPQPENLAYSDRGLGLHTDNPYREPVPGFQVLHALIASLEGGESLFADGFAIAEHLRATDPEAFAQLTQTPVPFLYRSKDAELYAERPLIQLSCRGDVAAVHYNSRSIAPLRLSAHDARPFYVAYRGFAALLREPRFQTTVRLRTGDLVAFDNQRTLHGRTGFSSAKYPRHLRGCYLTRDSVYCQTALLRRALDRNALI
jgi:alpha-ketoglutarate-dependent taurine dioxygenase